MTYTPFFRMRKDGPEIMVEDAIINQQHYFFSNDSYLPWTAGSVPIGAGVPDLIFASCNPQILKLADLDFNSYRLLAYLRLSNSVPLDSLIFDLRLKRKKTLTYLDWLISERVVGCNSKGFFLSTSWKRILPEITTVEVKVSNWKKAIDQANRNRIFAHRSMIALPDKVANRIAKLPFLEKLGIGLLSVSENNEVILLKKARKNKTMVWSYYYKLAYIIANSYKENNAVPYPNCPSSN